MILKLIADIVRHPRAALIGIREYRETTTTNPGEDRIESYDAGRELAHRATFRKYDEQ